MKKLLLMAAIVATSMAASAQDATELTFTASGNNFVYVGEMTQNTAYTVAGAEDLGISEWWIDPDFFAVNENGTFTFKALSGTYTLQADVANKGIRVWGMNDSENTGTLNADGTGYLWIIGSDCVGKPTYAQISGQSWWTDTDHALCLAPIKEKVYQISLEAGKQVNPEGVNFKFFGQAGWGTEFKGTASDHHISTDSDILKVGTDSSIDGNIVFADGVTSLNEGSTYVLTVDLTAGVADAKLTVEEQKESGIKSLHNGKNALKVEAIDGGLRVSAEAGTRVSIVTPAGAVKAQLLIDGEATIGGLSKGIYIVNGQKVVVR